MKRTFLILSPGKIAKRAKKAGMEIDAYLEQFRRKNHATVIQNPDAAFAVQRRHKRKAREKMVTA
jgi:hypothetical protein